MMTAALARAAVERDPLADTAWMNSDERALFERACALLPRIAQAEPATRAAREVPASHIAAIREADLVRILQPRRFGGLEMSTRLFSRVVEELTFGCASTAWVYAVLGEHQWVIACYPERAQEEVWGDDPAANASSSLVPRAHARRVDGGYRLSGSWPFSSGCGHAKWAIIGAFCGAEQNATHQRFCLVPLAQAQVVDDWQVLGLEGTGSRSLRLDDVFVPDHRTVSFDDLNAGTPPGAAAHPQWPMVRAPRMMFAPFSQPPVAISLARKLLDMVTDLARTRVSRAVTRVADSEITHLKLAESATEIETATRLLQWRRERAVQLLYSGVPIPPMEGLATRRDIVYTQKLVRSAADRLGTLAGAGWVYDANPLQPVLRDIQTCLTHGVAVFETAMVPYGKAMLSGDARMPT